MRVKRLIAVLALPMYLTPAALAGQAEDYEAYKMYAACSAHYLSPEAKHLVLQRDLDELAELDKKLSAHLRKSYSAQDAQRLSTTAYVEGAEMKPKNTRSGLQTCRKVVSELLRTY